MLTLAAGYSVKQTMHERKHGTLKSGSGKKVTNKKQAIAIGLSEARKAGAKSRPKGIEAPRIRRADFWNGRRIERTVLHFDRVQNFVATHGNVHDVLSVKVHFH